MYATSLYSVSAVSGRNAWAVGRHGDDTSILHWDGTRWSRVTSPNLGSDFNELDGVSAVSSTDVWAVGEADYSSDTLILHWDGTGWSRVLSPNPGSGSNELHGVSAVSPTDAWAVGDSRGLTTPVHETLILHWNGTRWSHVKSPNPSSEFNTLTGVSAVSPTDAWAVGLYWDQAGIGHSMVLHWDGTRWSQVKSPNLGSEHTSLSSVIAVSPKDVWAVGDYQEAGIHALVLHWDGTNWSQADVRRDR